MNQETLIEQSSQEKLEDTAVTLNAVPRQPTKESLFPIGHISLDSYSPDVETFDLDIPSNGVFWIKTFYVDQSIQGQGIGRAAMDQVEDMAVREPLLAKTLMLDTMQKDDQKREDFALDQFGAIPKVRGVVHFEIAQFTHFLQVTNEEWYARRGYQLIKTIQNHYKPVAKNGSIWDIKTVFMRKDIAVE